jgi:hypothetical protein
LKKESQIDALMEFITIAEGSRSNEETLERMRQWGRDRGVYRDKEEKGDRL